MTSGQCRAQPSAALPHAMNLILLHADELLSGNRVTLCDARFLHIRDVLRAGEGDSVKVGIVNGARGIAQITTLAKDHVELQYHCAEAPPAKLPLTVILALPRPKAARRLCRTIAELGAQKLILLNSYRVEKSYWQSPLLEPDKLHNYFIQGLQQAGDTTLPDIQIEKRFKPFVEDRLPEIARNTRALVAHPYGETTSHKSQCMPTVLAIGPEGGFIPYEIEKLNAAGLQTVQIGERILTTETAVPVLIAKLFD